MLAVIVQIELFQALLELVCLCHLLVIVRGVHGGSHAEEVIRFEFVSLLLVQINQHAELLHLLLILRFYVGNVLALLLLVPIQLVLQSPLIILEATIRT